MVTGNENDKRKRRNRNRNNKKEKKYFASSNPHPPHARAYDRERGCVNSSMVFEWLGAYDCSTSFALRALSTCLCVKLHLSAGRSRELKHRFREQKPSPFQKETRRGIKQSCLFAAQSNTKASPFPSLRVHTKAPIRNVNPTVRRAGH